ncbi:DUF4388 domain-containing protein [Paractinoplanes atraurantiacus]|uniref:PatA-like N-terminal domain-containing protein n=1 Tax=Paractinoplanes atraurantiacus TaxID=1036182 RepID=A0A285HGI9_9ACTN|nr:DUF4388 domain-containing protein [Actinoplanes atraurantiacus]SNY34798.1 hypothetical protein SAMN05421748_104337 [Actinoplanes atraurantiacus]
MTTLRTAAPSRLLTQVTGERQTGTLVVGGHPGGAVYVLEGRVIYAESPAAPGVGELLTASGRLAGRTWQNALDLGTSTARVGRLLVEQGHLTQGELELCVLGATYDAAYFALSAPEAPIDFLPGATHWLGPVAHIDPGAITREVRRRVRLLDEIFPDARVDTAPVIPVPRLPRERVPITALQWELLINADGQRTPADLALLLGKAGYATIQELRRMAALGLLELPEVRAVEAPELVRLPRARGTAVNIKRPVIRADDAPTVPVLKPGEAPPTVPVVSGARAAVPAPPPPPPPPSLPEAPPPAEPPRNSLSPPRLARRKPGAKLPKEVAGEPPPPVHPGTDEVLLKRIRTALRALR